MTKRRNCSGQLKATVALKALRGDKTVQEIAALFDDNEVAFDTAVSTVRTEGARAIRDGGDNFIPFKTNPDNRSFPWCGFHHDIVLARYSSTSWSGTDGKRCF